LLGRAVGLDREDKRSSVSDGRKGEGRAKKDDDAQRNRSLEIDRSTYSEGRHLWSVSAQEKEFDEAVSLTSRSFMTIDYERGG
jgi:hypothetical protein